LHWRERDIASSATHSSIV